MWWSESSEGIIRNPGSTLDGRPPLKATAHICKSNNSGPETRCTGFENHVAMQLAPGTSRSNTMPSSYGTCVYLNEEKKKQIQAAGGAGDENIHSTLCALCFMLCASCFVLHALCFVLCALCFLLCTLSLVLCALCFVLCALLCVLCPLPSSSCTPPCR